MAVARLRRYRAQSPEYCGLSQSSTLPNPPRGAAVSLSSVSDWNWPRFRRTSPLIVQRWVQLLRRRPRRRSTSLYFSPLPPLHPQLSSTPSPLSDHLYSS